MAKVVLATYFIVLTIYLTSAYQQECAVGPQYWCKSFQNAQDCGALRHCTDTVWRVDGKHPQVDSSTKCEWCQKILENTHKAIQNVANNEESVQSTLINGCKLLPLEDISTKCTNVIQNYGKTVVELMKHQRYDTLCHLMNICPKVDEKITPDDQSKMLCNAVVRATHELHVHQQKNRDEIQNFLTKDCQQLKNPQLVEKCENLVEQHGAEIYAHVVSNIELSKICDYLDTSALQVAPPVRCELCTVVVAIAKQMVDTKQPEDKVLRYIDEQLCSRLHENSKKSCRNLVDTNGRDLIQKIQQGMQPLLLCTHFQVCLNQIVEQTSPIQKNEMYSFLRNNLCDQLGSLKSACQALIEKDGTQILQILANDLNGKDLCQLFGLCPKKSLVIDQINLTDDPSKCKRCVADFTRRKHIAEKLVNHSSEFLHHLCGQLPQKDDCIKAVDESINELVTFIQSLDPKEICVQLNMCDQKSLQTVDKNAIAYSENVINEEVLEYIKTEVCPKLGSLSLLCVQLTDSEGLNLLNLLQKNLDPHRVCEILDVCPSNLVLKNCHDKCQCCANKVEVYQKKLEQFLRAMVASTRIMCDYVPGRAKCLQLADLFESNVNQVSKHFDSKKTCKVLSLCSSSQRQEDQCQTCKTEIDLRQTRFRTTINELTDKLLSLCNEPKCRTRVQSMQEEALNKIHQANSQILCQRLGYCLPGNSLEPSATVLRLRGLLQYQTKTLEERLEAHNVCSEYGQLKTMCEHLMNSMNSHRYGHVYLALLKNDRKSIDDDLREQMQTKVNANTCDSCKNAVQSSKDFWKNALESVLNVLLRTCDYCSVKDQCRDYYNRRVDDFKAYLDNIDPGQFCQSLHLCSTSLCAHMGAFQLSCEDALASFAQEPKSQEVALPTELATDSNTTCILCEYAMNILATYIHQKSTEQEIEQSLEKVCNEMPTTLRNQCHQFVEDYGPSIIATLLQEFDVKTICRKLNLCTSQMKVDLSPMTKVNEVACGVCDYVSTYIHFALKRDTSDKSLQRALSTVCAHLSSDQTSHCQTIVQLMSANVRQLQLGSGDNFCKKLTICQTPMSELKPAIHLQQELTTQKEEQFKQSIAQNLDDTPQCMLCRYVVSYLDAILKDNKSEAAIEAALEKVCTILPGKERVQCNEFIKTYGPVLAELLTEMADPQLVCRYLGLCQVVVPQDTTTTTTPVTYANHHYVRIPV